MNSISFRSIVKENLKAAGVHRFVNMKWAKANDLVRGLRSDLPLGNRGEMLISDLETRGYYQAKKYLINTLPKLTIGYENNEKECELLSSMVWYRSVPLLAGFSADRIRNMWHAYFKYNNNMAANLLDTLANTDIGLLKIALLGTTGLEEKDISLVSKLIKIGSKKGLPLPVSLVKLENSVIMKSIKELDFEDLSNSFIKLYMDMGDYYKADQKVMRSVLASLGVQRSFGFYKYLVKNGVIRASEALDKKYPDEQSLIKAMETKIENALENKISGIIEKSIEESIHEAFMLSVLKQANLSQVTRSEIH
jgi:hypothetical protein